MNIHEWVLVWERKLLSIAFPSWNREKIYIQPDYP